MFFQPAPRPAVIDSKAYEQIERGFLHGCAAQMRPDLERGVYWPGFDNPVYAVKSSTSHPALTAHAAAIHYFFLAASPLPHEGQLDGLIARAAVCRLLIEAEAPCFSAAPGTGHEDDYTYAAAMFTRKRWRPDIVHLIRPLFEDYVNAGLIRLDARINCSEESEAATRLLNKMPLEAAILLGNGEAARSMILLGAATDDFELHCRPCSVVEYAHQAAGGNRQAVAVAVSEALISLACGDAPAVTQRPAPRRARL